MSLAIPAFPGLAGSLIAALMLLPAGALFTAGTTGATTRPGEELPKGPPWHTEYRTAKREALRHGRPVFVYFTKTH